MSPSGSSVTAVLGPTNTGKTHRAVERMLEHSTGMIGLPLRLLAREIYDRVTTRIGEREVALVTGEEKRIPARPRYWVCTVEAMPTAREVDFLAVDEIQLVSHPERGHVFTDRLLHARGLRETWFLGSDVARLLVERLVPHAVVRSHPRLSKLRGTGATGLGGLPPRSAIVAFSVPRVYELAERIRERRGGAAVVLGALSPRARNAQVALYQSGEVDYMVATDAIGMGLNLDVLHVAFADLRKFDGKESRPLEPSELAQIAGRAGRYLNDGTFGTLAPLPAFSDATTRAVETHTFAASGQAMWRNSALDFSSPGALVASLRQPSRAKLLKLTGDAEDLSALLALSDRPDVRERCATRDDLELLWKVCQIPNFRGHLIEHHAELLAEVYAQLTGPGGRLAADWLAASIARLDDVDADIDTLLARMAGIRTFTYISHHGDWVPDPVHFQERARDVEDRLSDALHARLVARFVEGGGKARGPRARKRPHRLPDSRHEDAPPPANPFQKLAALRDALARHHAVEPATDDTTWLEDLVAAPHERFRVDPRGRIEDATGPLARLTRGKDLLNPEVAVTLDLGSGDRSRVQRRLVAFTRDLVGDLMRTLRGDEIRALSPAARGLAYQLEHNLGTLRSSAARAQIAALTADDRARLDAVGVSVGRLVVYVDSLLDEDSLRARTALLAAYSGDPGVTADGSPSIAIAPSVPQNVYVMLGYVPYGPRALRADLVERVRRRLRAARRGTEHETPSEIGDWLGCSGPDLERVLRAFGFPAPGAAPPGADGRRTRRPAQ